MDLAGLITLVSSIITILSGILSIIVFFRSSAPKSSTPVSPGTAASAQTRPRQAPSARAQASAFGATISQQVTGRLLGSATVPAAQPQYRQASPAGMQATYPGATTYQQTTRRPWIFRRIPHVSAFFGGLAVEAADIMWIILIMQPGSLNTFLGVLALLSFLFAVFLLVAFVVIIMIGMAHLKRWGWFVAILLGSLCGTACIVLPGIALVVFGLAGPRTPPAFSLPSQAFPPSSNARRLS